MSNKLSQQEFIEDKESDEKVLMTTTIRKYLMRITLNDEEKPYFERLKGFISDCESFELLYYKLEAMNMIDLTPREVVSFSTSFSRLKSTECLQFGEDFARVLVIGSISFAASSFIKNSRWEELKPSANDIALTGVGICAEPTLRMISTVLKNIWRCLRRIPCRCRCRHRSRN